VVVSSAPHGQILPHAAVLVTHCGHGTTLKALSKGVPILCMPMGRDQGDNAARVVWHGAGIRLKPTAPASAIAAALQKLLGDDRYRRAASALRERLAADSKDDRAVKELERLVPR
jgi:UDP:flavonoid glycosyltransferase YjiC (YdhE family)